MALSSFFTNPSVKRFLTRFFLLFGGVEVLLYLAPPLPYQEWLASTIGNMLHLATHSIWVGVSSGQFEVTPSCTGLTSAALFLGLIWGFSLPKKKAFYSLAGVLAILILNYIRLTLVIGAGSVYSLGLADWLHTLSWFVLSGIAFGMWIYILRKETGEKDWKKLGRALQSA